MTMRAGVSKNLAHRHSRLDVASDAVSTNSSRRQPHRLEQRLQGSCREGAAQDKDSHGATHGVWGSEFHFSRRGDTAKSKNPLRPSGKTPEVDDSGYTILVLVLYGMSVLTRLPGNLICMDVRTTSIDQQGKGSRAWRFALRIPEHAFPLD
ncbi:hypothetical protein Sjap_020684 [Stephania japonica]|uniref:Uncharacterized protein n=1 Tax=Stephania japonica TaxID=461633 RepID=A0AAP0F3U5_9MAGN